MRPYLDSSVLVAALTKESKTNAVYSWLSEQQPRHCMISEWTLTEVSSALSIKVRTGALLKDEHVNCLAAFEKMQSRTLNVLSIRSSYFSEAARLCGTPDLGLRAGDALHAAIAIDVQAEIVTLDIGFAKACKTLGLPVLTL
ncbi:MAG: type II toxin-antitoxin system VapC family toxin [Rhodospirillaceae bacterium]